ncbi:heme-dependent oxidative N-demethylase family protein [Ciceribacter azotifigens]|uniref:heme-dependent oxidative N-demethylase family protein n=1 Tax=Ciceribacter azotifigens TaxID=2069303 RepID=UPI003A85C77E
MEVTTTTSARPPRTPYDGSSAPFTIGLRPLELRRWIEPDEQLAGELAEKRRLFGLYADDIFMDAPDTRAGQQECLNLLSDYLPREHGEIYRRSGNVMHVAGHTVDLSDAAMPPLLRAGFLVQDDLVLMRRREDGWQIAAAHLSFPSSWSLKEKFGRPMEEVHAAVPGFAAGTRNATLVNRIFDSLHPDQPAERFNWSINWRHALFHPQTAKLPVEPSSTAVAADRAIVRVERQTLRKLPVSGDIVFTIRIYLDPIRAFATHPAGAELAERLAGQLETLTEAQVNYKGLAEKRDQLVSCLRDGLFAGNPGENGAA